MKNVTVNKKQKVYVIAYGKCCSCLGFDVAVRKRDALAAEMNVKIEKPAGRGTLRAYAQYIEMLDEVRRRNKATGFRSETELSPQLKGLEDCRVEVVDSSGDTRRFIVGRSTGWVPCHLEIPRRDSHGGPAVCGEPFRSVRVIQRNVR